jgi:YjjG family noncanonical pyrimidine nucleotidase
MFQSKITHIFFDLDHTLWDFDKNSELAFDKIFKKDHPSINIQDFIKVYIPINQACWKLYQNDKITHEVLRYNRLKHSFEAIQYDISDEDIEKIANEYLTFLPEFNHLFEDAINVLDYLKERYNLHIITNGFAEVQYKKINNSNIGSYFKTITNSEMAGAKKPNPKIFNHALNLAGANKNQSIMVGDCIDADVNGALDFGMEAIFFNSNNTKVAQNITQINNLAQLKNLF